MQNPPCGTGHRAGAVRSPSVSPAVREEMQAGSHRKENNSRQLMHDDNREAVKKEADAFHPDFWVPCSNA